MFTDRIGFAPVDSHHTTLISELKVVIKVVFSFYFVKDVGVGAIGKSLLVAVDINKSLVVYDSNILLCQCFNVVSDRNV